MRIGAHGGDRRGRTGKYCEELRYEHSLTPLNLQENAALNGRGCDILAGIRADADADFTALSRAIAL
jgi:hypothetical protein